MKSTIFDYLSIADAERIHSQMLAWIFSQPDNIIPIKIKTEILYSLFFISENDEYSPICVKTEFENIDILIQNEKYLFVIENKLKSSEHSNQTIKYKEIINKEFPNNKKVVKYCFLTLVNESPINTKWIAVSYEKLYLELKKIELKNEIREHIFIEEYLITIENLALAFKRFIDNHQNFPNVFDDGYKRKTDKKEQEDSVRDYIRVNQLETIFQKAFFQKICYLNKLSNYNVEETRGNALIQTYNYKFDYNNNVYRIGMQFQGKPLR